MDQTDTSFQANEPSIRGVSAMKSFSSSLKRKKKGKSKKEDLSVNSKATCLPPDLDIVSGFAFLSFSTIEELGCHIEEHEVNTRSLNINVERKPRKRPQKEEKPQHLSTVHSQNIHPKRIKIPSQKILESFATVDLNLNKVVSSNVSFGAKRAKVNTFPGSKTNSTNSSSLDSNFTLNLNIGEYLKEKEQCLKHFEIDVPGKESTSTKEISLECSEKIPVDVGLFEANDAVQQAKTTVSGMESMSSVAAAREDTGKKKKRKKRKQDRSINDQTCQTMFRIKKKKKNLEENTGGNIRTEQKLNENPILEKVEESLKDDFISTVKEEAGSHCKETDNEIFQFKNGKNVTVSSCLVHTERNTTETEANKIIAEEKVWSYPVNNFHLKGAKSQDLKVHRLKVSNKVEKIDYCARSGGVGLVEKYHERQNKIKQDDSSEYASCGQQFPVPCETESSGSCDLSNGTDYLSESSGNDSSNNSCYGDQEALLNAKSRIFSGSSSVFVSPQDETNDFSEIDVDSEGVDKPLMNIVKALPKSYLFGHLSTFPEKTAKGTIDVCIQAYENDIQLYMNYAADFEGKIIKIIVPDTEGAKTCFPRSSNMSGLPKFLQPQEYVKAVRSATERNRRHTIGDLFRNLKNELFGETRDYYFSKQAILSKAIETVRHFEVECNLLETEKNAVTFGNKQLRKKLNILLFGKDLVDDKLLDLNKVTEFLKTSGIEIEIPLGELEKDCNNSHEKDSDNLSKQEGEKSTQVTRKGRPPSEGGKLLKTLKPDPQKQLPKLTKPMELSKYINVAFNSKMKEYIEIAPSNNKNKSLSVDESKPNVEVSTSTEGNVNKTYRNDAIQKKPTDDSSGNKIVCNLTKYRIHEQTSPLTIVTNPEPVKGIESENVVHIKIANDTMKQVGIPKNTLAINTNAKLIVSLNKIEIESTNKRPKHVEKEQAAPISSNRQETQGSSKRLSKSSSSGAVFTKSTLDQSNLKEITPEYFVSKNKTDQGCLKDSESNCSQLHMSQTKSICENTRNNADEITVSVPKEGTFYLKKSIPPQDKVPTKSLEDIATVPAVATEGLKDIKENKSVTSPIYIAAKPQCTPQVCVPQTLPSHHSTSATHKYYTSMKPLQGKPLITQANVQQNQVVTSTPFTTLNSISIQSKPVAPAKQATKLNTVQGIAVLPATASKGRCIFKMQPLKPANISTQQNIPLLPANATTTTCGTNMVQLTPSLTTVISPQSIAVLPITSNVQMTPTITKVATPMTVMSNVTMATKGTPLIQMAQSTMSPQNIAVFSVGNKCTPIQMTQVTKVTSPHGIALGSSPKGKMPLSPSHFVALVRNPPPNTPHTVNQKTFVVPNASLPGMAPPFRIVFKPAAQPNVVSSPFSQIKNIIHSSSTIGPPSTKKVPIQQCVIPITTTITTSTSDKTNKVLFQDKIPVTNKKVGVHSALNKSNIPIQYRHVNAPPLPVLSVPPPPKTETLVRVQQAMPKPILSSVSQTPEKPNQVSSLRELHKHHSPEHKDTASKPQTTFGMPLNPTADSIVELLVARALNQQRRVQGPNKPSNINSNTSSVPGNSQVKVGGMSSNIQEFKTILPLSGSLHSANQVIIPPSHQDQESGLSKAHISQLTPKTTCDSTSVGSREAFSEMEKILAQIPSPTVTNTLTSGIRNASDLNRPNVPRTISHQKLDYDTRKVTQTVDENTDANLPMHNINEQVFKVVKPIEDNNLPNSQMTTSSTMSLPLSSVTCRNRMPSNEPICINSPTAETTGLTTVTFSNTCSSTKASFEDPKPKGDKTCSVVDSPEVISNVVSADTLSVCNIDSSIPDITSELTSQINPPLIGCSSSNLTSKEWLGSKVTGTQMNSGNDFELQDESTAEDFDLLSTLEWNDVSKDKNSCSPAINAFKMGEI